MTKTSKTAALADQQARASVWFKALQDDICRRFEALEDAAAPPLYRGDWPADSS
jgi:coproporphyrinogen III oxidase